MIYSFQKNTKLVFSPARTVQVPEQSGLIQKIDPSKFQWVDNAGLARLCLNSPGFPPMTKVMGEGTPTPYDTDWTDATALAALFKLLGIQADSDGNLGLVG